MAIVVGVAVAVTGGGILAAVGIGAAAGFWMNLGAGALDNALGGAAGEAVGDWLGPGGVRVLRGVRDGIQIAGLVADAIMLGVVAIGAARMPWAFRAASEAMGGMRFRPFAGRLFKGLKFSPSWGTKGGRVRYESHFDDFFAHEEGNVFKPFGGQWPWQPWRWRHIWWHGQKGKKVVWP